ncbi:MAG: hypothetical protein NVSMB52_17460 [Chloroflexota bacterium]
MRPFHRPVALLVGVALLAGWSVTFAAPGDASPPTALQAARLIVQPNTAETAHRPYFGDRLAYIARGKLYVGYPHARLVPGPGNAFKPVFSSDGQWLAFLRQQRTGYFVSSKLWVSRADGRDAHVVSSVREFTVEAFQWSPSADVLAGQPLSTEGEPLPIQIISVQGRSHTVPNHLHGSFLWLSDGRSLAIAATSPRGYTRLHVVRGTAVRSYTIPGIGRYGSIKLAAVWPAADSVVYWLDPQSCSSCIADGTPLMAFNLHTRTTRSLGGGLIYRDWIAVDGARLVAVVGGDRSAFFNKHLELCLVTGPCQRIGGSAPGQVTLDPALAPNSGHIAFVTAPAWKFWGFKSPKRYWRWLDNHVLWIVQPDGTGAMRAGVEVPKGVQDPEWTRDRRGLLFVKDGALWLDPHLGAANPSRIAQLVPAHWVPSFGKPVFQNWYYGHMNWHDLFAWY